VWFPRLYETQGWNNKLNELGDTIIEYDITNETKLKQLEILDKGGYMKPRVVFAKIKNELGQNLFKYIGAFECAQLQPNAKSGVIFNRIRKRENLAKYHA